MLRKIYRALVRIGEELHAIRINMESLSRNNSDATANYVPLSEVHKLNKPDAAANLDLLDAKISSGQTSINDARKMLALQPIEGGDSLITRV